jgi:lysyl-tRNA synthetase class 1
MFWPDRIVEDVVKRFGKSKSILIRDEKTVSGRVHVGSMRGVAIHGAVGETLADAGVQSTFIYEMNDFDPMDDIPVYLDRAAYEPHLGKPLYTVPSPEPSAKNYGEYFAKEFQAVIEGAGWRPQFTRASELYLSGKMDGVIREALDGAAAIIRIQKEVSGSERKPTWLPISVICPTCGKMATTDATDWDGETVQVNCYPTKVEYTKGCGFEGRLSPFLGKAKLFWKADWPAKWKVYGVMVEGGGKDHSTKGGSRDVGNHIAKEVFNYEPPFDIPYEFFLVGGQKMSSSKGRGSSAKEIADLMPTKIFRLALLGKDINQAINFDPEGDTLPTLYDQYDKLAENFWAGAKDDYARLFEMLHAGRTAPAKMSLPRFSQVAFMVQMPHLDMAKEFPDAAAEELAERAAYAKKWLAEYAPEKFVFKLQESLPEVARNLNEEQKAALRGLAAFIGSKGAMPGGEELHAKLHESKQFKAVYLAFLGKDHGPKAGWFISVLDKDFVLKRLHEASQ